MPKQDDTEQDNDTSLDTGDLTLEERQDLIEELESELDDNNQSTV